MDNTDAYRIVIRSRWQFNKDCIKSACRDSGILQQELALELGFGTSVNIESAAQYLSNRLRPGNRVKGERVLKAALFLKKDPYEIAYPSEDHDTAQLKRAIFQCINSEIHLDAFNHELTHQWYQAVSRGATSKTFSEWKVALKDSYWNLFEPKNIRTIREMVKQLVNNETNEILVRKLVMEAYAAQTAKIKSDTNLQKYALDISGLQTNFECWDTQTYQPLIAADSFCIDKPEFRTTRIFAVTLENLSHASNQRLENVISRQLALGIKVGIKVVDQNFDKEAYQDFAIIGDVAMNLRNFAFSITELSETKIHDLFVPANDRTRFKKIEEKLDWVKDEKAVDRMFNSKEEITEFLSDYKIPS